MNERLQHPQHKPRWRHKKRGSVYVVLGVGCLQTTRDAFLDNQQVTLYQSETGGIVWVRPTYEFMDGRFEKVDD